MAKTRIKQPAIEAAQDKAEVTAFIRQIGDLQREVKRLETEAGDKKAVIEEEYAAKAAPMCAEIMSLTERVAAYCEAHKDELTENGKTKTVDFTTGLIKWRIRPPSVKGNRRGRRLGVALREIRLCRVCTYEKGNRQRCHPESKRTFFRRPSAGD